METIKKIFKIGYGPSSSHTMGPAYACEEFLEKNKKATHFEVTLYGSLAMTGKGHMTDEVIRRILGKNTVINFDLEKEYDYHPNGMLMKAYLDNEVIDEELVFSVGGGDLKHLNEDRKVYGEQVYPHSKMSDILDYCKENQLSLVDYVKKYEDSTLIPYLEKVYKQMKETAHLGVFVDGILPGGLNVERKASSFYRKYLATIAKDSLQYAYALATSEENASAGTIVTAPTCGACGVVPSILLVQEEIYRVPEKLIIESLMIAGLIGTLVKTNASISGAEVGCQGEVGVACSMAAAALAYICGGSNEEIEYSAEIALEHNLGMTCDPVNGLVQIPCIERNAIASFTARSAAEYALIVGGKHYVSFDQVVEVMKETGKDLHCKYRETSIGGLATKKIN